MLEHRGPDVIQSLRSLSDQAKKKATIEKISDTP